jgi:hypothetical protein
MTVPRCITLAEYRKLEDAGKITRPLSDGPVGWTTAARRDNDAAASAAHTHHDPYGTADRKRPTTSVLPSCGEPHGYSAHQRRYELPCDACRLKKNETTRQQYAERKQNTRNGAPVRPSGELTAGTHPHDPDTANRHTDASRGTSVTHRTENPK